MTVQKLYVKNKYIGDGNNTVFPITFEWAKKHPESIQVWIRNSAGALGKTDNFMLKTSSNEDIWDVVYPSVGEPLGKGESIIIVRELPLLQVLNLVNQGPYFADDIEITFDEIVMMIQQLNERLARSFKVAVDIDGENTFDTTVPIEPGKTFRVKDDGTGFEVTEDPGQVLPLAKAELEALVREHAEAVKDLTDIKDKTETAKTDAEAAANEAQNIADTVQTIYVTPQMFGAKADGITDDTVAIQQANDTGKTVTFPKGVYAANNLNLSTKWEMQDGAIIKYNGATNGVCVNVSVNNTDCGDIIIDGNGMQPKRLLYVSGNNNSFRYVKLYNCTSTSILVQALYVIGNNNRFSRCEFFDLLNTGYDNDSTPQAVVLSGTATLNTFDNIYGDNVRSCVVNNADAGTTNYFGHIYAANCKDNGLYCVNGGLTIADSVYYDGDDNAIGFRHNTCAEIGNVYIARSLATSLFFGDCGDVSIGSIFVANYNTQPILHVNEATPRAGNIKIGSIKGSLLNTPYLALFDTRHSYDYTNVITSLSVENVDLTIKYTDAIVDTYNIASITACEEFHIGEIYIKAIAPNITNKVTFRTAINPNVLRPSSVRGVNVSFYNDDALTEINDNCGHIFTNSGQKNVELGRGFFNKSIQVLNSYSPIALDLKIPSNRGYVDIVAQGENSDTRAGVIRFTNGADNSKAIDLLAITNANTIMSAINILIDANNKLKVSVPTPMSDANDKQIVNAEWVSDQGYLTESEADNRYLKLVGGTVGGELLYKNSITYKSDTLEYNNAPASSQYPKPILLRDKNNNLLGYLQYNAAANGNRDFAYSVRGQDGNYASLLVRRGANGKNSFQADSKEFERVNDFKPKYIRYESGLQICWGDVEITTTDGVTTSFPIGFNAQPFVMLTSNYNTNCWALDLGTDSFTFKVNSVGSAGKITGRFLAIGTWK